MASKRHPHLKTAGVGLAGLALGLLVGPRLLRPPSAGPDGRKEPRAGAEPYLDRVIPELDLDAVGFDETIDRIRRLTGAPLHVRRRQLEASGIEPRTPVTFHARGATVAQA